MSKHQYQPVENAFRDGKIEEQSDDTLSSFLIALSNEVILNENVRHRDIIRGVTINHLLMKRHIDRLNRQNSRTQKLVISLTIAALIVGIPQIWFAYKADKRAETERTPNTTTSTQSKSQTLSPTQGQPPTTRQSESPVKVSTSIQRAN